MLGLLAAGGIVALVRLGEGRSLAPYYVCGTLAHLVGFHWIPGSIVRFGGFSWPVALLCFLAFALVFALQYSLFGWLCRHTPASLRNWFLDVPLAWLTAEMLVPHVFPWSLAQTQIPIVPFSSLAEFCGVPLLSALLLWVAAALFEGIRRARLRQWSPRALAVGSVGLALLTIGWIADARAQHIRAAAKTYKLGLVQCNANPGAEGDRGDALEVCRRLSKEAAGQGAELVIWPESVNRSGIPGRLTALRGTRFDPAPELDVPLVFGAVIFTQKSPEEWSLEGTERSLKFSAALALSAEGAITSRYHKRRLMPFGEYVPFASWFPWLKKLSPRTGNFAAGRSADPLNVRLGENNVKLGALICYEDLVPGLAGEAAMRGAGILVNQTNDAWYGDTVEPYQHHLLAQWRAIETRRYLLRVTNTGYTTVVDSSGQIEASLPTFQGGLLVHDVPDLAGRTLFMRVGSLPAWLGVGWTWVAVILSWRSLRAARQPIQR